MRRLARFAASPAGRFHGRVSRHYGMDPGAGLPPVLGANLRAALYVLEAQDQQRDEPSERELSTSDQVAAKIGRVERMIAAHG